MKNRASVGDYLITGALYTILILIFTCLGIAGLVCWAFDSVKDLVYGQQKDGLE